MGCYQKKLYTSVAVTLTPVYPTDACPDFHVGCRLDRELFALSTYKPGFMYLEIPQTVHTFTSVEPSGSIQHKTIFLVEPMDQDGCIVLEQEEKSFDDALSAEFVG